MTRFSHLHVHTQFSLLDGAASISSLYDKAIRDEMPALAISDHGNMFGVFDFVAQSYRHKREDGQPKVKPVVGCEFYLVADRHRKLFSKDQRDQRFHQILLAKNKTGYDHLVKLTSLGYIEGMYGKYPRIDKELVVQYHEGLIATTCCIGASVPQAILKEGEEKAEKEFRWWLDLFGEDFFVELQRHQIPEQEKVNQVLLRFAAKYRIPVIATNDSHYTEREDYNAHDILLCINTGEKQSTPGYDDFVNDDVQLKNRRFKFPNDQFYFKTTAEMKELFADLPEAIDNSNRVVDKVEWLNLQKDILLPAFPIPKEFQIHPDANLNQWEYLRHLTAEGAARRYSDVTAAIQERIDFELFTIRTMGFAGYFLIVSDFIREGRKMGVFVGPGRGSASGSVVAYCIGITNIDPIQYGLLFERFLSPDRKTLPDIDTDFDDEGRQKVIEYVVAKYGKNQVAQIITYGTMAAKMSIKDVARVLDLPLAESNALAKLVPDRPGIELRRLLHAPMFLSDGEKSLEEKEGLGPDDLENVRRLREIAGLGDARSQVLKEAARLEGSVRNTGIHAAGIIIAPQDLTDLIPVAIAKDSPLWVTQIEGNLIEKAGVLKMDFLGLKTLSILKTALGMIRDNHGREIDLDRLPLDDRKTFHLYQRGETNATFQFESAGMQKYLRELRPDKLDDLIVMNALYRPGPMAYIPQYIARKHGRELVEYDLADMQGILEETYGITVYQEQVMLLSQRLADFSKGDADVLRSAMGKKQKLILDKMKKQFIEGAMAKKHPREKLEKIWTDWEAFAQYAFNKSHSACYALVAYQTAYLKANYPSEYMAAVLNHAGSIEKITFYMEECKRMGLKVLGPDCNESQKGFAVNAKGEIRFGLGGLKGVGESAIESIITERSREGAYVDIFDFIRRINQRAVNKKSMESLAFSGAFDCFAALHRAQYFHIAAGETASGLDRIIRFGNMSQSHSMTNSNSLFGELTLPDIARPKIPVCDSWTLTELLEHEKEITGMFLSGHPLDHYQFEFKHYGITKLSELNEFREAPQIQANPGKVFRLAGLVIEAQHRVSRTGKQFGSLVIEDYSSKTEFMLWSEDYSKYASYLEKGKCLFLTGSFRLRYNRLETEFRIERIMLLESLLPHYTRQLILDLPAESVSEQLIRFVEGHCRKHPGRSSLKVNIVEPLTHCRAILQSPDNRFEMNDEMADFLCQNPDWGVQIVAG